MSESALGRRFWTLWGAFSSSNLGDGLTLVGFPLLAIELTDDARLIALVAAFRFLPFLTIGLPAGVLIDRFDRRRIAMSAQILRSASLVAIAVSVVTDTASILGVAAGAFVVGVGEVLTDGGLPAVVRDVVRTDQLETANSRLRAGETVANNVIGPPLGALVFGFGAAGPFIGAAALYVLTVVLLAALPGEFVAREGPPKGSFTNQMRSGLTYVWNHPVLRPLALTVGVFSFFGAATNAVLVILVTERLGFSEFQYGLLLTVDAVASVAMSFFVMKLVRRTSHGSSMKVSVITYAIQGILLGTATVLPLVVVALVFGGISDPTWNVISATVRQRLVDDHIFGRMMTAYLFIAWSFQPVGSMFGGFVTEAFGSQWVFIMAGVGVGSLLVLAAPMYRHIDSAMAAPDPSVAPEATEP